jgi:CO/xanthine dehydrogenase FAD-binding subunit
MRGHLGDYKLVTPASLDEALKLMSKEPGRWRPIAGGTDVMALLAAGKLPAGGLIDLWKLNDLRGIVVEPASVTLGALTTYTELQEHPILRAETAMLCQAASQTGGRAIQNRGTLGGNIAGASPAADSSPALLAYDAEVELMSSRSTRWLAYSKFHTGPQLTQMQPNEVIGRIRLPRKKHGRIELYRKVGTRNAQARSKVCFAACVDLDEKGKDVRAVRIALAGVALVVMRCPRTEDLVRQTWRNPDASARAAALLTEEIAPADDVRSTAAYRRVVSQNLLAQLIRKLRDHVGLDQPAG